MNKKRLILLTGDLATGKSTFARILAKRFELPCYHKDKIKEVFLYCNQKLIARYLAYEYK